MTLPKINPTTTKAWQALTDHYLASKDTHLKTLFEQDAKRAENFSVQWEDFFVDYSKNKIDNKTVELLLDLAKETELKAGIERYFAGEIINETEGRAVLHTALRANSRDKVVVDGTNVVEEVEAVKKQIQQFTNDVISGDKKGYTGKSITDIVNIGIGGSDLGPVMVTEALKFYKNHLNIHFVSNVDGDHVHEVIKELNPETTLFIIVSKSFTTQETLSNALTIKKWFLKSASEKDIATHFAAVSTNLAMINEFGIAQENVFPMWDWVGGRFSL